MSVQRFANTCARKVGWEKPPLETKGKVKWQSTTSHKKALPEYEFYPRCNTQHDRDVNAARNILSKALEMQKSA